MLPYFAEAWYGDRCKKDFLKVNHRSSAIPYTKEKTAGQKTFKSLSNNKLSPLYANPFLWVYLFSWVTATID